MRVLGVDDAPFRWGDATTPIVGVVMRGARSVEGVLRGDVTVDGDDATEAIVRMVRGSAFEQGLRAILVDGVALGGLNVVDVARLHAELGTPVLTVASGAPDLEAMRRAAARHVPGWERKWALVEAARPREIRTPGKSIVVHAQGMGDADVDALLALTTARGLVPEPLRVADLVASAFAARGK